MFNLDNKPMPVMSDKSDGIIRGSSCDILARTIYGEARGEYHHVEGGMTALIAVANVVMNRLKARSWYGGSVEEVCRKPWQFSCWNAGDPNQPIVMQDTIADPVFVLCYRVAQKVMDEEWPDLTKGSNHYHTLSVAPSWAKGQKPKMRLARHLFYHLKEI